MTRHRSITFAWLARLLVVALALYGFQPALAVMPAVQTAQHLAAPILDGVMTHDMTAGTMAGHDHAAMMAAREKATKTPAGHIQVPACFGKALACCPAMAASLVEPFTRLSDFGGPRLLAAASHALEDRPVAPLPDPPRNLSV